MRQTSNLLVDIVNNCRLISDLLGTYNQNQFAARVHDQAALVHYITNIGEAVKQLPSEWKDEHQSIPWSKIGRIRDHLVHRYFDIDQDLLWDIATRDIPELYKYLAPLVSSLFQEG